MKLVPLKSSTYGKHGCKLVEKNNTVGKLYYDADGDTFIINYITISKAHKKKGYAKKAIKMIMAMKEFKCFQTTTIRKNNTASRKLFKSLGFKEYPSGKQLYAKWCRK